jgi:hypothetical protein
MHRYCGAARTQRQGSAHRYYGAANAATTQRERIAITVQHERSDNAA